MPEQHHIVKRQVVELTLSRNEDTHRLHEAISRLCWSRLTPVLEKRCSALCQADVIHRIDTLELDLGKIPFERWEDALSQSFEKVLGIELGKAIAAKRSLDEPEAWVSQGTAERHSRWHGRRATRQADEFIDERTQFQVASQLELLDYYLNTGMLPWWADLSRDNLLEENLKFVIGHAPEPLRRAMRSFSQDDRALRRIALTYDDNLLELLMGLLSPALALRLRRFSPRLAQILAETTVARDWPRFRVRNLLWEDILRLAGNEHVKPISSTEFCRAVLQRIARQLGVGWRQFADDLRGKLAAGSPEDHPWLADLAASLQQDLTTTARVGTESAPSPEQHLADAERGFALQPTTSLPHQREAGPDLLQPVLSPAPISPEQGPPIDLRFSDSDEVYINNAGLVILWPFLEYFFKHLDLVEKKRFKSEANRQRAAGLLQYVASEEGSPPEYLLPLNKVLCGLEVDQVFDFGPPLTELEIEECNNLLTAVIAQAPILHEMSVPGFRVSFLLRNGQLSVRDGIWLLRVERQTFDIVLDRFPWSINWVKLPWMQAPIQVEW